MAIAASTSLAFRSGSLSVAISRSCSVVMDPTFLMRNDAGGVLVTNVKLRSSYTVISTGMTIPACCAVAALYSLQNPMMLTPLEPNAGPMGGAGLAFPASMASLITPVTFFAMHVTTRRDLAVPRAEQRAEAADEARLRVAIALLARPAAPLRTQSLASTPYAGHLEQEKCGVTRLSREQSPH